MGKTEKSRSIWNGKTAASDLLPTLLPNLFTYRLQMLYKLLENTPRELLFGVYKYQKIKKRERWGFEPVLKPVEGWGIFGPIWAEPPLENCKTC